MVGITGENSQTSTGRLNKQELDRLKKIIPTLDEIKLEGFIIVDAGSSIIDCRRADKSTGTVERHGEPTDEAAPKDYLKLSRHFCKKRAAFERTVLNLMPIPHSVA